MRILFDSKSLSHKDPFGTLIPGQKCTLQIHVPTTVGATKVQCLIRLESSSQELTADMFPVEKRGSYDIFSGSFSLKEPGLYFYYFRVFTPGNAFRLFKAGNDTNMEDGGKRNEGEDEQGACNNIGELIDKL